MDETDGGDTGGGDTGGGDTGGDTGGNNTGNTFDTGGGGVPPGVDGPVSTPNAIVRYEELNDNGGGRAEEIKYDGYTDTFSVDNLAFDGEGPYTRVAPDNSISSIGPNNSFAVYNAEVTVPDFLNSGAVVQIVPYRAIVGISKVPTDGVPPTSFAIVRTGGYEDFGFGGFVYQRSGDVVMPTTGQARFDGDYAGMRVFDGAGGLEYTEASLRIDLDFDDPTDATAGVKGRLYNRVAYDLNGEVIASNNNNVEAPDDADLPLPNISFVLDGDNGNVSVDGELNGSLAVNQYLNENGGLVDYESGTYYAILAGDTMQPNGGEIVGVLVIDSTDPRRDGVTVQETGGFILYRDDTATPIP
jgi:hypothetical protein